MNAYIYKAALYCESCVEEIDNGAGFGGIDPYIAQRQGLDSDDVPVGPYPDGGGEADTPQHCDSCGLFLENPLTEEGERYVLGAVTAAEPGEAVEEWRGFYDYLNFTQAMIEQLAREFKTDQRTDGSDYIVATTERAKELVYNCHEGTLPRDSVYELVSAVLDQLAEGCGPCDLELIYYHKMLAWLGDYPDAFGRVDEALSEGETTLDGAISLAYIRAAEEIQAEIESFVDDLLS